MKSFLRYIGVKLTTRRSVIIFAVISSVFGIAALVTVIDGAMLRNAVDSALSDPVGLTLATGAFLVAFLLRSVAWRRIVPGLTLGQSLAGIHLALGANHVLPLRLGEPLRVASVVRRTSTSLDVAASSTLALRSADIICVLGLAWILAPNAMQGVVGGWIVPVAAVLGLVAVGSGIWLVKTARATSSVRLPGPVTLGLTAVAWLFEAVLVWQSASWAGLEIGFSDALVVTTIAVSAQIVAIAPSGIGTYEAASVAAYLALGHDSETALVAAVTAHALKTLYSLIAGGIAVFAPSPGFLGRLRLPRTIGQSPQAEVARRRGPAEAGRPIVLFMPALNEEKAVGECIRRVPAEIAGHPVHTLIIDDGSTDRTAQIATNTGAEVVSFGETRGLGAGVRFGLEHAMTHNPVAVAFCDADEEYPPEELENLVTPILEGEADYVVGSRFLGTIEHMRPHRRLGNIVLTKLVAFLSRTPVTDGQSGYRAFSPEAAFSAEIIHDFNYAQVITLDLIAKGFRYQEVGITYRFRTSGKSFIKLGPYLRRVVPAVARELNTT
ncbi:MAG: glycosyltransferase [Ilumatobacteraceae bacterium]